MAHGTASVWSRDGAPEIMSHNTFMGCRIEILWKNEDDLSDLSIWLNLDEAVTLIEGLSAVVFAAKAGVYTDDDG